ncbi:MAG: InlB B-repeat-containing protein [Clostridia bacterium]|nr:InlB B-repeat-containing protein [Clostridia bacterium]
MKKKFLFVSIIICLLLAVLLTGCSFLGGGDDEKEYKLIFVGTSIPSAPVVDGVVTLPKNPTREGYVFDGWYVDSACTILFDQKYLNEHPITSDIRLYHRWVEIGSNDVTFTLDVNGGVALVDAEVVITKGVHSEQTLPVPTRGGYVFVGWYDAEVGGNQIADEEGIVSYYNGEDATLYARWEETTYEIIVNSMDATVGSVSGGKANATYLEEITITATTLDDNYIFVGWFEGDDLVSEDLEYEFEVTEDVTFTAKWIGEERVVNFYRNYTEGDESFVSYTYNYGSQVSYTPSRRAGYSFIGWYDNVDCVGEPVCVNGIFEKMTYANNTCLYAGWSEGHDQLQYAPIGSTNAVKVVGVNDGAGAIIHIPTEWSGYDVTTIGANVFKNSNKNAIIISSSITAIEDGAFDGATAKIYFDKGADLTLLNDGNFTQSQEIYTHLTLESENELSDGNYVESNGILADDVINSVDEGRAFYAYCWLYTYTKPFTLTITEEVYSGNDSGFIGAMTGADGVFKNVNIEMSLKSETRSNYDISYSSSQRELTFTFTKDAGVMLASGYTDGGKQQVQTKSLIGINNVGETHDFAIDGMPEYVVYNSEQLVYAVEYGYKPVFGVAGTSAENCYNKARQALTQIINPTMSEIEKITAIHDYVALNVTYDSALLSLSTAPGVDAEDVIHYRGFYIEGVFEDGKAVCDGITKAFMLMCRIEGIEAIRVAGVSRSWNQSLGQYVEVGHAWNKVHVDGVWYTIDVTNDDSIIRLDGTDYEVLNHRLFMVSDASIASSHIENETLHPHVSTGTYNYHANTKYDDTRDLVITSQVELDIITQKLVALANNTDTFYTVEVIFEGVNPESLNFTKHLGSYAYVPKYEIGDSGIYLINFLKK